MPTDRERRVRFFKDAEQVLADGQVLTVPDLMNIYARNGYCVTQPFNWFDQEVWSGRFLDATGMEVTSMTITLRTQGRRHLARAYYCSSLNLWTETDFLRKFQNISRISNSYSISNQDGVCRVRNKSWANLMFDHFKFK